MDIRRDFSIICARDMKKDSNRIVYSAEPVALVVSCAVFAVGCGLISWLLWLRPGASNHWSVAAFVLVLCTCICLIILGHFLGRIVIDGTGIRQWTLYDRWGMTWADVSDWSTLEVYYGSVSDDAEDWHPVVALKSVAGGIKVVGRPMLSKERLHNIRAILTERCGPPKDIDNPVLPASMSSNERRWID